MIKRYKYQKKTKKFSIEDALNLLKECKQDGKYGTKVSFVYSKNENRVYYCLNGDFDTILIHKFD